MNVTALTAGPCVIQRTPFCILKHKRIDFLPSSLNGDEL